MYSWKCNRVISWLCNAVFTHFTHLMIKVSGHVSLLTVPLTGYCTISLFYNKGLKGDPWLRGPSHTLNCPNLNFCAKSLIWASSIVVFLCLHCLFTFRRKQNNNKIGPPFDLLNTTKIQIGAIQCVTCPFQPGSTQVLYNL